MPEREKSSVINNKIKNIIKMRKEDFIKILQETAPAESFRESFQSRLEDRIAVIESEEFTEPVTQSEVKVKVTRILKIRANRIIPEKQNYLTIRQDCEHYFDGDMKWKTRCSIGIYNYSEIGDENEVN